MNLNLTYKVLKSCCKGKYLYLYQLPQSKYAVVLYEEDDDTIQESFFFQCYKEALGKYNEIKKLLYKEK